MTQAKPSISPAYFKDYRLAQAEEEAVAAAIDNEQAMRIALSILKVDDFRSECADDLRMIFYACAGWLAKGTYDPQTNRDRLLGLAENHTGNNRDLPAWEGYLEMLWCPWATSAQYVTALCTAITETNRLFDARMEAELSWQNRILRDYERQVTPPSPVASRQPRLSERDWGRIRERRKP